jgi:hypothetical protein
MKLENLLPRFALTERVVPAVRPGQEIKGWVQRCVHALVGNREPRIFHRRDRQGYSYLEVYDPVSGKTHYFHTTHEVRVWLERRYYNP